MPPASPKQPRHLITFQHLVKTHHGRIYFLGGSGLAMVIASSFGLGALINPRLPLPGIDPLLGQKPQRMAALVVQDPELEKTLTHDPIAQPPTTLTENPETGASRLSLGIYSLIIASSLAGSSLLTYALYRLQRQSQRSSQARQKPSQNMRRSPLPMSPPQDS